LNLISVPRDFTKHHRHAFLLRNWNGVGDERKVGRVGVFGFDLSFEFGWRTGNPSKFQLCGRI
jgi:hypothetical protein